MVGKRVAIVLVNYNGFSDTDMCLDSLMQLTSDIQISLVLVDNASKDASKLEGLKDKYQGLHIIYNQQNIGFGRANNIGIQWVQKHVEFDYICLLNNDTIVEPDFLEHLIEPFAQDPQIGMTTGKIYYEYDRNVVWYGGAEINHKRGWPQVADYNGRATENGANRLRYVSFVSGCLMLFSKKAILELKGFDDHFFMYCEDLELCLRATRLNIGMYYQPRSIIYHKVQGSSSVKEVGMKASNPKLAFIYSNMKSNQYLALKKNTTGLNMVLFAFVFHAELLLLTIKLVLKGRTNIIPEYFKILGRTRKG